MKGNGVIVMRLDNGHRPFFEHPTLGSARIEAHRLAHSVGGEFVIYVPIAVVRAAVVEEIAIQIPDAHFDDLPF